METSLTFVITAENIDNVPGDLFDYRYEFPVIEACKKGSDKKTYWRITADLLQNETPIKIAKEEQVWTTDLPNTKGRLRVESWLEGGKVRDAAPTYIKVGKNIGRANATNIWTQTLREGWTRYNKQKQGKLGITYDDRVLYEPMLAQEWKGDALTLPFWYQPKLDGVRTIATMGSKDVVFYSRNRKIYTAYDHIRPELKQIFDKYPNVYLDGEMYKHGTSLQEISGFARRGLDSKTAAKKPQNIQLEYHVYDVFLGEEPMLYEERYKLLEDIWASVAQQGFKYVQRVETHKITADNDAEAILKNAYTNYLENGYEGLMIRLNDNYEFSKNGYHSKVLLKMKPTMDAEYKIVGYTEGTVGKSKGVLIFVLETPNNKQFTINLGMTIEDRKKEYNKMSNVEANNKTYFENTYLGKMLNIKYQDLSTDGIPMRATTEGIVVRDYE